MYPMPLVSSLVHLLAVAVGRLYKGGGDYCISTSILILNFILDACKKAILETIENTDSRKEMVLRLIQLRIRFEDMKERANVASNINSSLETRGHVFIR